MLKQFIEKNTVTKESISQELAQRLSKAVEARANEIKTPMCIAVCDESGVIKAFLRMDNAPLVSIDVALNKAKTSVAWGMPTHEIHDFIKDDSPLTLGAPHIKDTVVFGGGYPVKINDQVVGGIGVSGGHYTQDMECAQTALALLFSE